RIRVLIRLRDAEQPGRLALHLVRDADRRRLRDEPGADRGGLELGGPDPLARDVERVGAAPVEGPGAVLVDGRPVAVRPHAGEAAPVRVEVALRVATYAAGHAGPRAPADELSDLAAHGVAVRVDDVHVLPERGEAERDGLDRLDDAGAQEA